MNLRDKAFPEFADSHDPEPMPHEFKDSSWKNDACPSYRHEGLGLVLFIDHENPEEREDPCWDRFSISFDSEKYDGNDSILSSNEWNVMLAAIALANLFPRMEG